MDYKAKLQANNIELENNNIDLQSILDVVNALPEASGGSAATQFEFHEITINLDVDDGLVVEMYGPTVNENGEIVSLYEEIVSGKTYRIPMYFNETSVMRFLLWNPNSDAVPSSIQIEDNGGGCCELYNNGETCYCYFCESFPHYNNWQCWIRFWRWLGLS